MLISKISAVIIFCVMVVVATTPAVIGTMNESVAIGPTEHVERDKGLGSPKNSATIVEYTMLESGKLSFYIDWYNLSAIKLKIYNVTDGSSIIILSERVRAPRDGSSVYSTPVHVLAGNTYRVVAIPGGAPGKGDYAEITPFLDTWIPGYGPIAAIDAPDYGYVNESVLMDGSQSYDPDGMIVQWLWDFGDGTTGTGEVVTHYYIAPGTYWIYLEVIDNGGLNNSTAKSILVIETSPVTEIDISGTIGKNEWYVSDVSVELNASDDWSGVNWTKYRLNEENWQEYNEPLTIQEDGIHTLEFYSEDLSENTEEIQTVEIKIDQTMPVLSITQTNGTIFDSSNITISWSGLDNISGIDHFEYCLDNGSYLSCGVSTSVNQTELNNGSHIISVRAYDEAGNMAWDEILFEVNISTEDDIEGETEGFEYYWWLVIGIIIIVIVIALIFYFLRPKKGSPEVSSILPEKSPQ